MAAEGGSPGNIGKYLTLMENNGKLYADVILPLKFGGEITYLIPDHLKDLVVTGSRVKVNFSNRDYIAVIFSISPDKAELQGKIRVKEIISVEELPPVTQKELELWKWVSQYYMCSLGEVYKAAYPWRFPVKIKAVKERNESKKTLALPELSECQSLVHKSVCDNLKEKKSILFTGSSDSGKTEMLIRVISDFLSAGKSVLYLVPEISLGDEISVKLREYFQEKLLLYHSGISRGEKFRINRLLCGEKSPFLLLGTRSSIFLPFGALSLVIVDQEHDPSYKQSDPSPRYNGRDCALILAKIHGTGVILSSATPSLESLYNARSGRYKAIDVTNPLSVKTPVPLEIIDSAKERKRGRITGDFPDCILEQIRETTLRGEQVLVYLNRRAYSPGVQCIYCGDVPFCPECNIPYSFHKTSGELKCHYCGGTLQFSTICTRCGKPGLKEKGTGTEKVEESLRRIIPGAVVSRMDQDTAGKKSSLEKILKEFKNHKADILVGTRMIRRGRAFRGVSLVCILRAESMLSVQDFRSAERALQEIDQLSGLIDCKKENGKVLIETSRAADPFFAALASLPPAERVKRILENELREREEYEWPPFTRLIRITLKSHSQEKLEKLTRMVEKRSAFWSVKETGGPFAPFNEMVRGEHHIQFLLTLKRNRSLERIKEEIFKDLTECARESSSSVRISVDVDPY